MPELHGARLEADRVAAMAASMEQGLARKTFSGTDRKRIVTVTLDRQGLVLDVVLVADWKKKATANMLGESVVGALDAARKELVAEVAGAMEQADLGTFAAMMRARHAADDTEATW